MSANETRADQPTVLFDDGKAPGAMRTIGEVATGLGIRQHVLRYWEQQFPMLQPLKRSGGRRYYRSADVALVQRIDALINRQGYTLKGARQVLEEGGAEPSTPASRDAGHADLLASLTSIRARLARALEAA